MTDLHEWLDQKALASGPRTELQPETSLWHAFEWDRQHYGRPKGLQCPECGADTRQPHELAKHFPGTRRAARRNGTCYECHAGIRIIRPHVKLGDPCEGCGDPMRPGKYRQEHYPGTARHKSLGLCTICYRLYKKGELNKR